MFYLFGRKWKPGELKSSKPDRERKKSAFLKFYCGMQLNFKETENFHEF